MLILGGLFSIPVYLVILFQSKKRNIQIQLSKKVNIKKKNSLSTLFIICFPFNYYYYYDIYNSIVFLIRSLYNSNTKRITIILSNNNIIRFLSGLVIINDT
jgi:hypothetical protein